MLQCTIHPNGSGYDQSAVAPWKSPGRKWLLISSFTPINFQFSLIEWGHFYMKFIRSKCNGKHLPHTKLCPSAPQTPRGSRIELLHPSLFSPLDVISPPPLFMQPSFHPSIQLHYFAVIICGARRRPLVSLGCFPDSQGCAWWWPWRLGTAGWCGLWAGWRSSTAPFHPGGHRLFVGRHWCCQNESRMKSAGSWCPGDHWMQRCAEGWWVGKNNSKAMRSCDNTSLVWSDMTFIFWWAFEAACKTSQDFHFVSRKPVLQSPIKVKL